MWQSWVAGTEPCSCMQQLRRHMRMPSMALHVRALAACWGQLLEGVQRMGDARGRMHTPSMALHTRAQTIGCWRRCGAWTTWQGAAGPLHLSRSCLRT